MRKSVCDGGYPSIFVQDDAVRYGHHAIGPVHGLARVQPHPGPDGPLLEKGCDRRLILGGDGDELHGLARFELADTVNPIRLACDQRGGLLAIGSLATLNGQPFTGLARLLPDGTTDPAFRVCITNGIPNFPTTLQFPGAITVQQAWRGPEDVA